MTIFSGRGLSGLARTFVAGLALFATAGGAAAASVTIGGKNFTEQLILAEMTRQLLEAKGYDVTKNDGMGTTIVRAALESGQVDLYWEYTGTSLVTFNKVTDKLSPEETYARVKQLDGEKGLVWLAPSKANNTYAMAIRPDNAKTEGLTTISEMAAAYRDGKPMVMATTAEFPKRPDGLAGLQQVYDFQVERADLKPMELGLAYNALGNGDVDIVAVQATDGQVASMNLTLLEDDKTFFPNYVVVPVVRKEVLDANPDLQATLESLSGKLDDGVMRRLNSEVELEGKPIEAVATQYLTEAKLI